MCFWGALMHDGNQGEPPFPAKFSTTLVSRLRPPTFLHQKKTGWEYSCFRKERKEKTSTLFVPVQNFQCSRDCTDFIFWKIRKSMKFKIYVDILWVSNSRRPFKSGTCEQPSISNFSLTGKPTSTFNEKVLKWECLIEVLSTCNPPPIP